MNNIFADTENNKKDYVKRFLEKGPNDDPQYSPMAPPEAYQPQGVETVPFEEMHPVLQLFMNEHKVTLEKIKVLETTLLEIKKEGINKELNKKLGDFFAYLDDQIVMHNLKEQKVIFPILHDRMLDNGEHGIGPVRETAVDMLENDHVKMMELGTLTFSLLGISSRITDLVSRALLLDTAIEQGLQLVEMMRLHVFREDNVAFPLAHKYLKPEDYDDMVAKMKKYFSIKVPEKTMQHAEG